MADLLVPPRPAKTVQNGAGFSGTGPGFVKPIRNGLRKVPVQNLIKCRPSRAKPAWREKRMELDSRKKSRRD